MLPTVDVSPEEKCQFVREGLIIRKGFVPPALVESAQQLVQRWYDTSFDVTMIEGYTKKTFAPELGRHPFLLNVYFQSGLASLASALVAPDPIQPVSAVQIQIRVPNKLPLPMQPEKSMHVDGVACPHLDLKELRTFTLLIGVLLSTVDKVDCGAVRYLPGAHTEMADWFRSDWVPGTTVQVPPRVNARASLPFFGEPGDVIVMHHLLPHAVGPNTTQRPRHMLYFRVKHERHDEHILEALRDPWLEFPSLRESIT